MTRRYRDKERSSPTANTSSTLPEKKVTSQQTAASHSKVQTKQPLPKTNKKIDMGAALNFGKTDLGINSPTHRNTHAEEDLFATDNIVTANNNGISRNHNNNDDLFKACSTPSPTNIKVDNHSDFEFNPREDEPEFGDFASAFGDAAAVGAKQPIATAPIKDSFADFNVGFVTSPTNANLTNSLFDAAPQQSISLFGPSGGNSLSSLMSQPQSQTPSADLLSDFGGLNMNSPALNGE